MLESKTFVQDTYIREMNDDIDDDLNHIDTKDLIRKDLAI